MLDFKIIYNKKTKQSMIVTSISGKLLLTTPQLNKGTAFTKKERFDFELLGKLPYKIETIDEQVNRAYLQYLSYRTNLQKNIYLNNLHDNNQVLFYKLLDSYIGEILPIIYTPIVGKAVEKFHHEYRRPRGLYIAYKDKNKIDKIIQNRSHPEVDLIVVTDGERILGLGDQGIGGINIPIAKLMVYTSCGGINPTRTLPIFLDVGTNNKTLLNNPLYLGYKKKRISSNKYYEFIDCFVKTIKKHLPNVFLHWEDFGRRNARKILEKFQNKICTFNDDIQGTGIVTVAALLTACKITNSHLHNQRILIFGAGSAGTGISDQIVETMMFYGLTKKNAYKKFWLIDKQGLLVNTDKNLTKAQIPYARKIEELKDWTIKKKYPSLIETIKEIKPTVLIGTSAQFGAFSKEIIETLCYVCERPIIFPLSNPYEKCEAHPKDIIFWSKGKALIATGTAFPKIYYENNFLEITQCNNALVFPGIGLGIIAVKPKILSKNMIFAATQALSQYLDEKKNNFSKLLPTLNEAKFVAKNIAFAVAKTAIHENLAQININVNLKKLINDIFWKPEYLPFKRIK